MTVRTTASITAGTPPRTTGAGETTRDLDAARAAHATLKVHEAHVADCNRRVTAARAELRRAQQARSNARAALWVTALRARTAGLTYRQIAEALGVTTHRAQQIVLRATLELL